MRILKDCISVLMEGTPAEIDAEMLKQDISKIKGVKECHDIHVWSLSTGKIAMSCHLVSENPEDSLKEATEITKNKYKIKHSTIQVESFNTGVKHDCEHDLH